MIQLISLQSTEYVGRRKPKLTINLLNPPGVSRKRLTVRSHRDETVLSEVVSTSKCVSTICDECNRVELEIGTNSKQEALKGRYSQCK